MKLEDIGSSKIKRNKFIDTISDEIKDFNFIVKKTINNAYFKILNLQKDIKKIYKLHIDKRYIYQILKEKKITYKKATIKEKPKTVEDVDKEIKNKIAEIVKINGNDDNIAFIDEVHIDISEIN